MSDFVTFHGGLTVPVEAWLLAIDLELRHLQLVADGATLRVIGPSGKPDLSPEDRESIKKWKPHLLGIVAYCTEDHNFPLQQALQVVTPDKKPRLRL